MLLRRLKPPLRLWVFPRGWGSAARLGSVGLQGAGNVGSRVSALLESDKVSRVGVSVYDAAGLETAAETFDAAGVPLGEIQVPANVLDRRLDSSQLLINLAESGSRIVVRSAFLQGVLLSSGGGLADHADVVRFRESVGTGARWKRAWGT